MRLSDTNEKIHWLWLAAFIAAAISQPAFVAAQQKQERQVQPKKKFSTKRLPTAFMRGDDVIHSAHKFVDCSTDEAAALRARP